MSIYLDKCLAGGTTGDSPVASASSCVHGTSQDIRVRPKLRVAGPEGEVGLQEAGEQIKEGLLAMRRGDQALEVKWRM